LLPDFDQYESDINLHLESERDRQLQLRGHMDSDRRKDNYWRSVHAFHHGNCDHHCHVNPGFDQVRLGERYGDGVTVYRFGDRFVQPEDSARREEQSMYSNDSRDRRL